MADQETTSEETAEFTLGEAAANVYHQLMGRRANVEDLAYKMAELTIPSVFPPRGYRTGDDIPGNNQSVGAYCVNTLASHLMFMAFPPNQPIMRLEAIEYAVQKQVDQDPQLWAAMQVSLSRLEEAHRKRFYTTTIRSAYVGYLKLLLVAGNALWKHLALNHPTYVSPRHYVVKRDAHGAPILSIHEEHTHVQSLPDDVQKFLMAEDADLEKKDEWLRETCIYSVCKLKVEGDSTKDDDKSWLYWQETEKGTLIPGTHVETDFDYPPMWPGWLIPVFGDDWGRSYCEEYRGDLYTMEALASAGNDGAALAALAQVYVKPGGSTPIKKVREARNLEVIPGNASDVTVFRSEKSADLSVASNREEGVARRLSRAFLVQSSIQRDGERVTKEEIVRLGSELDQAMGGLYTEIAQTSQRPIILRAMRLNEEENPQLPILPKGLVSVQVTTGIDAMGQSEEESSLIEWGQEMAKIFPQTIQMDVDGRDYGERLAAVKGIKPDGLILTEQAVAQKQQMQQAAQMRQTALEKGTAPAVAAIADRLPNLQPGQPPAPQGA